MNSDMNSEIIIEVEGLYKTYPGAAQPAVNGISLAIHRESFFGLLGPNGAGKTTFLSMLTGLLKPDSGRIGVAGLDIMDNLNEIKHRLIFFWVLKKINSLTPPPPSSPPGGGGMKVGMGFYGLFCLKVSNLERYQFSVDTKPAFHCFFYCLFKTKVHWQEKIPFGCCPPQPFADRRI